MTDARTEALLYASLGWHVVPIVSGSKNPGSIVGAGWPAHASCDQRQVDKWFSDDLNIGVLLGSRSGIIDVEYDNEEGEQIIEAVAAGIETPTYRSAKSVHRIFRWDNRFDAEQSKCGWRGTEWRFGQNSAQSVFPPSLHETGIRYEWLPGLSPRDVLPIALPEALWDLFHELKQAGEKQHSRTPDCHVPRRYVEGDSLLSKARKHIESTMSWEGILTADGWSFIRTRGNAQDWRRPGKKSGSLSATVNYGDSGTLRVFTSSADPLKHDSSYDKFAYLCCMKFDDDPVKAAFGLCPEQTLKTETDNRPVDLSWILGAERTEDFDDEEFCNDNIPQTGLIRDVFNYYWKTSHRSSAVMGLAVAVSLCQTIFGRRVTSQTDLRTNDYNVIIAPTSSGKEACETTISKILLSADAARVPMIPPDVQSGNGLVHAIAKQKYAVWVCDEFGKTLEAVLDKKANNAHAKQIGTHLLKLYGKSSGVYGGAAHSDGTRNMVVQPHLCLLGLTTGQIFESIDSRQIQDGLFGRLAFWPVQNRPRRKTARSIDVPESLAVVVRQWVQWEPVTFNPEFPAPVTVEMTPLSLERWEQHADAIDEQMQVESESRAAIWGRVAARALKLALMHRCARLESDPSATDWPSVEIEIADIEWGIHMANWLARIACGLIRENVVDLQAQRAQATILRVLGATGEIDRRKLMREYRSISGSEFSAAADVLQKQGLIVIEEVPTKTKCRVVYKLPIVGGTD